MCYTSYPPAEVSGLLAGLTTRSLGAQTSIALDTSDFLPVESLDMMNMTTLLIAQKSNLFRMDALLSSIINITHNISLLNMVLLQHFLLAFIFFPRGHPIDSPTIFMLAIKPTPKKHPLSPFNQISFHRRFYLDDDPKSLILCPGG